MSVVAYEWAEREGRVADLLLIQRPVDHRRSGQSAWISYRGGADKSLWAAPAMRPPDAMTRGASVNAGAGLRPHGPALAAGQHWPQASRAQGGRSPGPAGRHAD